MRLSPIFSAQSLGLPWRELALESREEPAQDSGGLLAFGRHCWSVVVPVVVVVVAWLLLFVGSLVRQAIRSSIGGSLVWRWLCWGRPPFL